MSSVRAENGAGLLMAVKRRHGQSTSGAKVTGLACVAQATEISQGGAPVGTCNPVWAQNAGTWLGLAVDASQGAESQPFKSL